MRRAPVAVLIVLLAGCADSQDAGPEADGEGLPATVLPTEMSWSGCRGVWTEFLWPANNPSPDFEQWGEGNPVFSQIFHIAVECERFAFGLLERGPVSFVWELNSERRPPDACLNLQPGGFPLVIGRMFVNDPSVQSALADEGMPVQLTDIVLETTTGAGFRARVAWGEGGSRSYLEAVQEAPSGQLQYIRSQPIRLFWANPTGGVSAVDLGRELEGPNFPQARPVVGQLGPEMSMAGQYAGHGFHVGHADFGHAIYRFADPQCERSV